MQFVMVLPLSALCLAAVFWYFRILGPQGDEHLHQDQILRFARGDFSMNPDITQIPGYHAMIAAVEAAVQRYSLFSTRLASLGVSFLSVLVFFGFSASLDRKGTAMRTMQYVLLPILTPYFALAYTDTASLLFVLIAFWLAEHRRVTLAGIAGAAAILIRQTNIVWLLCLLLFLTWEGEYLRYADAVRKSLENWWDVHVRFYIRKHAAWRWLQEYWIYLLIFLGFAAFAVVNHGGIALGDQGAHPFPSFHLGNAYFCLLAACCLFLPLHIANLPRIAALLRKRTWLLALLPLGYAFYMLTFVNDHPNNQLDYFLRNKILMFSTSSLLWKSVFFVPTAFATLSLAVTRLKRPSHYLLYPVTVLALIPSWLIEQRYFLVPFALFLAFRERRHWIVEWAHVVLYTGLTGFFLWGIREGRFFL